ncbi:voltage-dependent calcium channel subunit alpha-2/delta-4-like isoform X2 [Salvelinus fontinalis]|uniref:voltage-dependent calcium channel subunit alpha-2/delta-4-like isoform X2 n=1 Tax=Salvelinus fontinalis TaxID=8038 RepID=UPI002486CDCB|nr:voltage-dependent calcium channel subunit alpha-2/delta-4-like isoform X2 [Salvelinus fontinalis]
MALVGGRRGGPKRSVHFKVLVDELHVKGEGKVAKAMKESFKILNEAATKGQGSLCNQAFMLITDGAMEDFKDVFEEFNWPDRRVRLFTYLIGRVMTFADNTKWIACNNKGYYTHISTLADVQENVMEYLHVLSRPMVINHNHDIIWTEAYMDTVLFATKAQSLLLMTTVAMPVFSKKKETVSGLKAYVRFKCIFNIGMVVIKVITVRSCNCSSPFEAPDYSSPIACYNCSNLEL